MIKHRYQDHPLQECADTAATYIAKGASVYQKWTCRNCGERCTMNEPNTFHTSGKCEDCGFITDISKHGCNYLLAMPLHRQRP